MKEIRSESIAWQGDFGLVWKSTVVGSWLKAVQTGWKIGRLLWNECTLFSLACLLKLVFSEFSVSWLAWWAMGRSSTVNPHVPSMSTRLFSTGTPSETSVVGLNHVATWASMEFPWGFPLVPCFLPQCHQCPALKKDLSAKCWKLDDSSDSRWSWRKGHNLMVECSFVFFSLQPRCSRERDCMVGCGSRIYEYYATLMSYARATMSRYRQMWFLVVCWNILCRCWIKFSAAPPWFGSATRQQIQSVVKQWSPLQWIGVASKATLTGQCAPLRWNQCPILSQMVRLNLPKLANFSDFRYPGWSNCNLT